MIAAIEINELWIAVPSGVAGIAFLCYALWPTANGQRIAFCCGSFLVLVAAFAYAVADPPTAPTPRPAPNRPDAVVVTPVAGGLAELVPTEVRGKVGRYYLELATVIDGASNIKTTEQLREAYRSACGLMKRACHLPEGLVNFHSAVDGLLKDSLTLESQTVTDETRRKFANVCRTVAAELGVTP